MNNPSVPQPLHEERRIERKDGENRVRLPLVLIVVGLGLWGGFLAFGAYLGISDQAPSHDPRRAWVMLISSGSFLLFWLSALFWRGRRVRRTGSAHPKRSMRTSSEQQDKTG